MISSRKRNALKEINRYRSISDNRGYLLLEILIAVAIFSIGFLAVGTLIVSTTRTNTTGNIATQAALLAVETLEALKKDPVADLVPDTYNDPNNPVDEWGDKGGIFKRSWVIDDPIGYNSSRRVRVTVSWNRLGQNRRVELTTITRGNGT
jgi:prepilin-type N-terminal cleavage/methylation domain-containing protein